MVFCLASRCKTRLQCTQNKIIQFLLKVPALTYIGAQWFGLVSTLPVRLHIKQFKLVYNTVNGNAPQVIYHHRSTQHVIEMPSTQDPVLWLSNYQVLTPLAKLLSALLAGNELFSPVQSYMRSQFLFDHLNSWLVCMLLNFHILSYFCTILMITFLLTFKI